MWVAVLQAVLVFDFPTVLLPLLLLAFPPTPELGAFFFMKHWVIQNNTSKWNQILLLSCFWNHPKHHEKDQGCEILFPSVAEPAENIPYSGFFFVFTFLNSQHCQAKIKCVMQKHKWKLNCCRCRTIPLSSCYLIFPHSRLKNE